MRIQNDKIKNIEVVRIQQAFPNKKIQNLELALESEFAKVSTLIYPGKSIAIAVGSRGIADISKIVQQVVNFVKDCDANPFIIPAMGSHGGATAEGQRKVLEGFGITEATMRCPVRSSMEVVELEQRESPVPVYMDKYAYEADGVFLVNRVKPHTNFHHTYESGLVKMMTIGLGKQKQAYVLHTYGTQGMIEYMPAASKDVMGSGKIMGGLAIVENAYDETMFMEGLLPGEIHKREPELLQMAKENMPKLPVKDIDTLIVDVIGKNISGVGMDPNIIGRIKIPGQDDPEYPNINSIYVRDLTPATNGNAVGIGLADVISRTVFEKINYALTYENVFTSGNYERVKIPIIADNDEEAIQFTLRQNEETPVNAARIIRIKDTLHLQDIFVSMPVWEEIKGLENIETVGKRIKLTGNNAQMFNFEKILGVD